MGIAGGGFRVRAAGVQGFTALPIQCSAARGGHFWISASPKINPKLSLELLCRKTASYAQETCRWPMAKLSQRLSTSQGTSAESWASVVQIR